MRALVFDDLKHVTCVEDAPEPELTEGNVLVRLTHSALCGSNAAPFTGDGIWADSERPSSPGWMGHETVGVIEESKSAKWKAGTQVLALPNGFAGYQESFLSNENLMAALPETDDPGRLVIAQPMATVMQAIERLESPIGKRCAVVGQGGIGLMFTNLLTHMGASQVIGIDRVASRLDWSRRMGATDTFCNADGNAIEAVKELTGGEMVDIVVEAADSPDAIALAPLLARKRGSFCAFGVPHHKEVTLPWLDITARELVMTATRNPGRAVRYFETAMRLINDERCEIGQLVTPRMPWTKAQKAFEMFTNPWDYPDAIKITLEW